MPITPILFERPCSPMTVAAASASKSVWASMKSMFLFFCSIVWVVCGFDRVEVVGLFHGDLDVGRKAILSFRPAGAPPGRGAGALQASTLHGFLLAWALINRSPWKPPIW